MKWPVELPATSYDSLVRWFAVVVALSTTLCGCSPTPPANTVAPLYTCIPPARSDEPSVVEHQVAVIGDSYTGGTLQGGSRDKRWTAVVAADLRQHGIDAIMRVGAEGGSGYVAHGRRSGKVFADMVSATVRRRDSVVVVFGSINDAKVPAGEMARATCDTLRSAEMAAPAASLLVIGPPWVHGDPPPDILKCRDILRTRAQELGAKFLDPIADGWFVDRPDLIGADGIHPTDAGHDYMAQKIEPVLQQQLNP